MSKRTAIVIAHEDYDSMQHLVQCIGDLGFEPVPCTNSTAALEAFTREDGPKLGILSNQLRDPDTIAVCNYVRNNVVGAQPYLLLSVPDSPMGLHYLESADALLLEPWTELQLLALVSVGQRHIALQNDLHRYVEELESLLRRHNLLVEITTRRRGIELAEARAAESAAADDAKISSAATPTHSSVEAPPPAPEPEATLPASTAPGLSEQFLALETAQALPGLLTDTFMMMGLTAEPVAPSPLGGLTTWCALYVKKLEHWLEFAISMPRSSAENLVEAMLGAPPADDTELQDGMSELLNIMQSSVKMSLEGESYEVLYPFLPTVADTEALQLQHRRAYERWHLDLMGEKVAITLLDHACPVRKLNPDALVVGQLITEDLVSTEKPDVVLLKASTVLNERYVDHLQRLATRKISLRAAVVEPTPLFGQDIAVKVVGAK